MKQLLQIKIKIPVSIKKDGDIYVSGCHNLDIYSQGKSEKEALGNAFEAISLFMETCFSMGTLNQVLTDSGFSSAESSELLVDNEDDDNCHYLNVPISLIANAQNHAC